MRTEEELAIWALAEVLVLWLLAIHFLLTEFNQLPANLVSVLAFSLFALAFLPLMALALSIRHFRKERKENSKS